jgi:hypothetical protein
MIKTLHETVLEVVVSVYVHCPVNCLGLRAKLLSTVRRDHWLLE